MRCLACPAGLLDLSFAISLNMKILNLKQTVRTMLNFIYARLLAFYLPTVALLCYLQKYSLEDFTNEQKRNFLLSMCFATIAAICCRRHRLLYALTVCHPFTNVIITCMCDVQCGDRNDATVLLLRHHWHGNLCSVHQSAKKLLRVRTQLAHVMFLIAIL